MGVAVILNPSGGEPVGLLAVTADARSGRTTGLGAATTTVGGASSPVATLKLTLLDVACLPSG
jgi:hypothetical protein